MKPDDPNRFEEEYLRKWWEATRHYWFADPDSLHSDTDATHTPPSCTGGQHDRRDALPHEESGASIEEAWSPPGADSQTRFILHSLVGLGSGTVSPSPLTPLPEGEGHFSLLPQGEGQGMRVRRMEMGMAAGSDQPTKVSGMNTEHRRLLSPLPLLPIALYLSLLAGCAATPELKPPKAPEADAYTTTALPAQTASAPTALGGAQRYVMEAPVGAQWWRQFGSPKLDALIEQAERSNPGLEAAQATLRQARQNYAALAGTTRYPQANGALGAQRQGINTAAMGLPGGERTFNLYNAGVNVRYDLDLAGGNRQALQALASKTDHQRFQLEGARLDLAGNLAATAINQAQLAAQIEAGEGILAAQEEQLDLTRQRHALGVASQHEVLTLQTQLEQTRAGIPPLRKRLEQTRHLLATLAGQPPGAAALPQFTLADFTLPGELPLRLPSELARRRPDIRAAEALLAAAGAQHGVAVARLYPRIELSADLGSQALTASSLFGSGSLVWGLAGQLAQPLFNRGLRAEVGAAEAAFDAAAANYRQTILQALREVADILAAQEHDALELNARAQADAAAQQALELLRRQYELGAASYLQLVVAQQQAQQTRIELAAAQAQRLFDTAALYQAMGGGALEVQASGSAS